MAGTQQQHASTDAPELALDSSSQTGFIKWFASLSQDPTVVRFFDRKGFFSVHGDAALMVARDFYHTTAVVKHLGGSGDAGGTPGAGARPAAAGLPSVTLNKTLFETVLRSLLLEGGQHSVELWEGAGASWQLTRQASPGRLGAFEEALFRVGGDGAAAAAGADAPLLAALWVGVSDGQRLVGVAFLDAASRRLGACELPDDDHFCATEALLLQLGVREAALPRLAAAGPGSGKDAGDSAATPAAPSAGKANGSGTLGAAAAAADAARLRDALTRAGVMSVELQRNAFATKNLEADLGRLLQSASVEQHRDVLERPAAAYALAGLLSHSALMSDPAGHGRHTLALHDPGRFMRLDAAALRALNVLPQRGDGPGGFSLYSLMCRARTPMGKRLLRAWLKAPLVDPAAIRQRLDVVDAMVADAGLRTALRDAMRGMPDIERLTRKLEARRTSLADLCQLYRASSVLPRLEDALRCHEGSASSLLCERYASPLAQHHDDAHLTKFELLLEASLDLEAVPQEYLVSAAYDPRLQALREERDAAEARIGQLAAAAAKDLGLILDKTIKLEWHKVATTRTRCLRITQKEEKAVRTKLHAKYLTLETRKDGTKFTNRALKEAAEAQADVSGRYETLQRDLVTQVVAVAATFAGVWSEVASLLAELDVLAGFADLACSDPTRPYTRPDILEPDAGEIVLKAARHPCVEVQESQQSFVPNDCELRRGSSWFAIITGPNMGGKSTYIRQVGCLVLMAQVGCFVPAAAARIAPRDAIFARVGAGDCQARGVSTFMAEMLETGAILRGATARSLLIIDELGRGTSTYDGFGLAWAIAEHVMEELGAPTLFATHFHELTAIDGPGGVVNLHVTTQLDEATGRLAMLYGISPGACDQSFGIHVAESAHFPVSVVEAAKRKLAELEAAARGGGRPTADGNDTCMRESGGGGPATLVGIKRGRSAAGGGGDDAAAGGGADQQASNAKAAGPLISAAKRFLGDFASLPLADASIGDGAAAADAALALLIQLEADAALDEALGALLVPPTGA